MIANSLVSVIVPVHNVRTFLIEALDSLLFQSYKDLEIILIDDGSTDGSGLICDEYAGKDSRIIVVHQEKKGLSYARNVGLDMMTGEVAAFLDPDDAYHPDFIRIMMAAMVRENADLVMCRYTVHDSAGKMTPNGKEKSGPSVAQGIYARENFLRSLADRKINISVWNKLYRRNLWENIRFPVGHVFEDRDTTFRILNECKKACVVNEALYYYRERPGSISSVFSIGYLNDWLLAQSHYEAFIRENIPGIFTEEHLRKNKQVRLNKLIRFYVGYSKEAENKLNVSCEQLRTQIIETGKEIDIYGILPRVCYWMVSYCPWILKKIFPACYRLFRLIR